MRLKLGLRSKYDDTEHIVKFIIDLYLHVGRFIGLKKTLLNGEKHVLKCDPLIRTVGGPCNGFKASLLSKFVTPYFDCINVSNF